MKNATYSIEFFHNFEKTWQSAGLNLFDTHEEAVKIMEVEEKKTDHIIDFRVVEVSLWQSTKWHKTCLQVTQNMVLYKYRQNQTNHDRPSTR